MGRSTNDFDWFVGKKSKPVFNVLNSDARLVLRIKALLQIVCNGQVTTFGYTKLCFIAFSTNICTQSGGIVVDR